MLKRYFARPDVQAGLLCLGILLLVTILFFAPLLTGKVLPQGDVIQATGMQENLRKAREANPNEEPYWSESMFSGMPAETIGIHYQGNVLIYFHRLVSDHLVLPYPMWHFFIGMALFFGLLRATGIRPWLALAGALGFGFFSYHPMIIEAGHVNKFMVLMFAPGVLWGLVRLYQGRYVTGFLLVLISLGCNLFYNHVQMSYYLFFLIACLLVWFLVRTIQTKLWRRFVLASALFGAGTIGAILLNAVPLYPLYAYSQYTIRGPNELSTKTAGAGEAGGLDRDDYAFSWSYDKGELLTLLVPNAYGGASSGSLPTDGATVSALRGLGQLPAAPEELVKQLPSYWGEQPFTSGPFYLGAVLVFLAVLGLMLGRGGLKYALLYAILLALLLALGKYSVSLGAGLLILALPTIYLLTWTRLRLQPQLYGALLTFAALLIVAFDPGGYRLTDFFFDYLPLYNKFRVPSSTLVLAAFATPWLALLGAQRLLEDDTTPRDRTRAIYWAAGITGGICLVLAVAGSALFGFTAPFDEQLEPQVGPAIMSAIRQDRESLLQMDALRSLALIVIAAGLGWLAIRRTIKPTAFGILLAVVVLLDLAVVGRRVLPGDAYVRKNEYKANFEPRESELVLSRDTTFYRVFPVTRNPFNDGRTPYFVNSIGGYNAAKLRRYQQLIERHLSQGLGNPNVLNMLHTKYVVANQEINNVGWLLNAYKTRDNDFIYINKTDYGPAWFVREVAVVPTPQAALDTIGNVLSFETAVIEQSQQSLLTPVDTSAVDREAETIQLTERGNNLRVYHTSSPKARFATFSEVYYPGGWSATIDGKEAPIFQTNFVLRGLVIPAGQHKVVFRYLPTAVKQAESVSWAMSIVLVVALLGGLFLAYREQRSPNATKDEDPDVLS